MTKDQAIALAKSFVGQERANNQAIDRVVFRNKKPKAGTSISDRHDWPAFLRQAPHWQINFRCGNQDVIPSHDIVLVFEDGEVTEFPMM
ncbi:MAG: hypothetical protein AAGB26_08020 [Planctomycetota bacterium]